MAPAHGAGGGDEQHGGCILATPEIPDGRARLFTLYRRMRWTLPDGMSTTIPFTS